MKRLLIRAGIFVGLTLMLGIAGHAQVSQQYRAEIPFDFQVKNVNYSAGTFSVGPMSPNSGTAGVAILDRKRGKTQVLGLTSLADNPSIETGKLIFVKANGTYTLSHILTPTFEIKMKAAKSDARFAGTTGEKLETVAIALTH